MSGRGTGSRVYRFYPETSRSSRETQQGPEVQTPELAQTPELLKGRLVHLSNHQRWHINTLLVHTRHTHSLWFNLKVSMVRGICRLLTMTRLLASSVSRWAKIVISKRMFRMEANKLFEVLGRCLHQLPAHMSNRVSSLACSRLQGERN